ncbi:MAG TPA: ribosome maturation factor RimP [Acidimicrobiales bacterium]|nr:ribosome maturation factor RimP [Acidimicrobiales bacterium]
MGAEEHIVVALQPVLAAAGLDIWDVELAGTSVRILVDRPGGADLDAIAGVTPAISALLDERDDLVPGGRYTLEVSSPGLERRLRHPRHFAAYVGEQVAVKTSQAVCGQRRLRGTLVAASDDTISLTLSEGDSTGGTDVKVPLSVIEKANAVFEWGAPSPRPKVGAASDKKARAAGRKEAAQPPSGLDVPVEGLGEPVQGLPAGNYASAGTAEASEEVR